MNLKEELAEFALEFLCELRNEVKIWYHNQIGRINKPVEAFFHDFEFAPQLMHLGKREMEKRGFTWETYSCLNGKYICRIQGAEHRGTISDENEYIAFWSAVREAVNEDK